MKATELLSNSLSQLDHLRNIVDPPYLRIARELTQQQTYMNLLSSPLQDIARDSAKFNEMANIVNPLSRSLTLQLQEQQDSITQMFKNVTELPQVKLARQWHEQHESITNMMKMAVESPAFRVLRELQEHQDFVGSHFQKATSITAEFQKLLGSTFITSSLVLQAHSTSITSAIEEHFFDGTIDDDAISDDVATELRARLNEIVKCIVLYLSRYIEIKKPTIYDIISLVLAVHSVFYGNISDEKIKNFFREEIASSEKRMILSITEAKDKKDLVESYVVKHATCIRVKPTHKSAKIDSLYKNQLVTILSKKKEWVYVQYFDYIEAIPKTGWIAKKYITRVKARP